MPYGGVGGMERVAFSFYNYYKSQGHVVYGLKFISKCDDIISFSDDELFLSSIDLDGMHVFKRLIFYLTTPLKLRKIINEKNITHSITFGDVANLFSSLTFTKEYKIGSIHALKSIELKNPSILNKAVLLAYRTSFSKFDKVVSISHDIRNDLINHCGYGFSESLKVIYNPHDLKRIIKMSEEDILNDSEKILFNKPVLLFLGRLSFQKAPWHLIRIFKEINKTLPEVQLAIIGDGSAEITELIQDMIYSFGLEKSIHFLGRKNNPFPYLKKAHALALTSYYEGTPNVIVESIALETTVITTLCTKGVLEIMDDNYTPGQSYNFENTIITPAGFVTPKIQEVSILNSEELVRKPLTREEMLFKKAINTVFISKEYSKLNNDSKNKLLKKFDLKKVSQLYLKP